MKKTAVGLFHILPAESEAPGTEINGPLFNPYKKRRGYPKVFSLLFEHPLLYGYQFNFIAF
ncbi:hypothetical protein J7I80_07510 [Bacillus sp. ISL-41]|uniref:hypothetical protein n=1 Tax=Bacillus sp. ISL-41 TaxID=2819127 RepID=UPI001BE92453|nr:hypothetical protein [Bacillus sp. ISL-41]MBT2642066.1 hypothetical protein [Bacillus sp. ISL-41]